MYISDVQFLRAFDLTKSKFEEILNSNLTYEEAKSLNLDKQALSFLIREAIFMNEFEKLKIFLDKIIIAKISKNYVPFLYDENNIYHSVGLGVNLYGLQFILASRLDRNKDNWSVLFDFAGFFGRENYLPQ